MKRPLPPELVVLGDHLETAVRRSVSQRPSRRQAFLNAAAALLIALPLLPAVLGAAVPPREAARPPAAVAPAKAGSGGAKDDFPPRVLSGTERRSGDVLAEPSTLRRALR